MVLASQTFGRLLEPGLRKIFMETYKEVPEQYSQVFHVQDSKKAIETDLRMGGFGMWEKKDSAGSVQYDDVPDTKPLQYIHEEYAKGFTVERKLVDDEMYNQINKMPAGLSRGARATIETISANIFNNAFTTNGFDGQPLISTSHVRLDGGSMNNRLSTGQGAGAADGALSDRNLKAALIQVRKNSVDDKGIKIQVIPKVLVVPPALEYIAQTLIKSANISAQGTGSGMTNDTNVLQSRLKIVVMDYLTSDTAWFLLDPTVHQLNFFWRKRLEFKNTEDFDTMQAKYRGYMRFSVGYSDYRGVFGSLGTGAA